MSDEKKPLTDKKAAQLVAAQQAEEQARQRVAMQAHLARQKRSAATTTMTAQRAVDNWNESLTTEASIAMLMPERKDAPFFFRQLNGAGAPHDWNFTRDRTVVGRSKGADFSIDSPELSRKHICILRTGKSFKCLDLESRNGIYLDGVRVHSLILRHGDIIQLGNISFLFCEGV